VTVFLSLVTAAIFGTGDFFGGLAAKRARIVQVVAGSHLVGLIGVTAVALLVAESFSSQDFLLGAVGGLFGGLGVGLLYRRLAVGPMAVVAPITAITSAAVPALWSLVNGESLSSLVWLGVIVALVAIGMVSYSDDGAGADITVPVIAESLLAGVGFGAFFIFLDATESASAPWPVVGARLMTSGSLLIFLLVSQRGEIGQIVPRASGALALIAATGVLDTASNVIFLYATNRGSLTIV